jgi:hypothetical protein
MNHLTMNLERFMTRAVFALYPGISCHGKLAIINDITNDRKHEDEVEFVDKKESNESANEASVFLAVIQEHLAVLGLANPTNRVPELKKIRKDTIASFSGIPCFWTVNSNARQR